MKTIQERAHDYASKQGGEDRQGIKGMIYAGAKQRYEFIAHEQRNIDIEDASTIVWDILENLCPENLVLRDKVSTELARIMETYDSYKEWVFSKEQ